MNRDSAYAHSMNRDATLYKSLGKLIRTKRRALDLTQAELAAILRISRASLANIETGRQNVLVHQLYHLAEALDLPAHDLLPATSKRAPESGDLPLPKGLTPQQRTQIARVLSDGRERKITTGSKGE